MFAFVFDRQTAPILTGVDRWTTDLASVPKFLWGVVPSYGRHTLPALMHDTLCQEAETEQQERPEVAPYSRFERRRADQLFRVALADAANMGLVRRWLMWAAVRLHGAPWVALVVAAIVMLGLVWTFLNAMGDPLAKYAMWLPYVLLGLTVAVVAAVLLHGPENNPGTLERVVGFGPAGSLLGAAALGVAAAPLVIPVSLVTLITSGLLAAVDAMGEWVCFLARRCQPRKRFTVFPMPPHPVGVTAPGDSTPDRLDEFKVVAVDPSRAMVLPPGRRAAGPPGRRAAGPRSRGSR